MDMNCLQLHLHTDTHTHQCQHVRGKPPFPLADFWHLLSWVTCCESHVGDQTCTCRHKMHHPASDNQHILLGHHMQSCNLTSSYPSHTSFFPRAIIAVNSKKTTALITPKTKCSFTTQCRVFELNWLATDGTRSFQCTQVLSFLNRRCQN